MSNFETRKFFIKENKKVEKTPNKYFKNKSQHAFFKI